ncbi:MAG: hypothetical protein H7Y15_13015, partial [Pseudonocardia sp.]|nr:hypothetical protein [Pseudonocardia sp.]
VAHPLALLRAVWLLWLVWRVLHDWSSLSARSSGWLRSRRGRIRRRVEPRVLAGVAAVVTLVGGVICGGAAVVMNVANGPATVGMLATNPLALPSMTLSGLALLAILTTSARAFRVATHDPSRRRPSSTQTVRALRRP